MCPSDISNQRSALTGGGVDSSAAITDPAEAAAAFGSVAIGVSGPAIAVAAAAVAAVEAGVAVAAPEGGAGL